MSKGKRLTADKCKQLADPDCKMCAGKGYYYSAWVYTGETEYPPAYACMCTDKKGKQ